MHSSRSGRISLRRGVSPHIFPIGKTDMPDRPDPTRVRTPEDLAKIVRAARKDSGADQVTAAGLVGVGPRFLGDLERGKPNLRLGLVLRTLDRLGLEVHVAPRGSPKARR
jgi:hypothetical protein